MPAHTVTSYETELFELDKKISHLGGLAEHILRSALTSLEKQDQNLAQSAIDQDAALDDLEREIDSLAINMIARRQPLADDLRRILAALKIAHELERIGDLAKNIAKRTLAIGGRGTGLPSGLGLHRLGQQAARQLKDVLEAFGDRNEVLALRVWRGDQRIDEAYNSVFRELLTYMMEDPRNIGTSTHLLFGAKNIERIGDHATNIAEIVHYLVEGRAIASERPKGDVTSSTLLDMPE